MARRRYQRGSLRKRVGKNKTVWVAQWREDVVEGGVVERRFRKEVLGTIKDFPTRKLAERELEKRLAHVNDASYRPTVKMGWAEFSHKWETDVLPLHKPSSRDSEAAHLRKYINPFFNAWALCDITSPLVQRFVTSLEVAPKTVRNIYATFRNMWRCAKRWGLVKQDVCEKGAIMLPRLLPIERPAFTIEQMTAIIAAAEEPFKTFFWLASETGMRIGELCGLRRCDIGDGEVRVRQSVWRGQSGTPKSMAGTRRCSISEGLAEALRGLCERGGDQMSTVFHTRTGQPWDSRFIVRDVLRPLLDKLGIPRAGMHAFRHGNATYRLRAGEDVKTLAARLGHADPKITLQIYAHAADGREMSDKMGALLNPVSRPKDAKQAEAFVVPLSDQQVTASA